MDRLDLRLVEYFVTVAEELHFGRAAQRLHIAQPSLSQQIRRLENQLGVTLLNRNSRHVELTAAGQVLLTEGREALSQAQHAIHATRAASAETLNVGFYGSAAAQLLPDTLRAFSDRRPSCRVSVRELLMGSIDDILNGNVSIAFTRLRPGQTELEVDVLMEEPRVVAVATTHPLARHDAISYAELADERFIVNHANPTDGPPARWLAEQHRHGLPGRPAMQASSVQEILTLVAAEHGICLVPSAVAHQYPRPDVTYLPCTDADPAVVSLAWRSGPVGPVQTAFIETVRETARALKVPPAPTDAPNSR